MKCKAEPKGKPTRARGPKKATRVAGPEKTAAAGKGVVADCTLTPLELVALSKAVKDTAVKDARPKLTDGGHAVDFTVRVAGPVLVSPRLPGTVKEDVPAELLLGLVVARLSGAARADVCDQIGRELAGWRSGGGDDLPKVSDDANEVTGALLAHGHREFQGHKNGAVHCPLSVTLIERAASAQSAAAN